MASSVKKAFKTLKLLGRRRRCLGPIHRFDTRSDQTGSVAASGLRGGMLKTRIDSFLDSPGLTDAMKKSELRVRPEEAKRIYFNWDLPAFLWEAILGSETLKAAMTSYLGPRLRLDDLYVKSVMDGLNATAEGWHDDNVGYRLKVFMVFDTEGTPSGTVVVPTERPHLYQIRIRDEISRFMFKPKTDDREGAVRVAYEPGDCLVFDTNIPHRGDYHSGTGIRYCVIAEFIDRDKADALRGLAPCGPGQSLHRIRIPALAGCDVANHPLIDPSILEADGDGWLYGYR
ncbi:MAG: hypothetical protein JNK34_07895 [Tabrizicola sp.]|nr:hypothetical protein [Tabrizicola sp.]